MKKYAHIYFDLDNTLWDFSINSNSTLLDILNHSLLKGYQNIDVDGFIEAFNYYNNRLFEMYKKGELKKSFIFVERFRLTLKKFGVEEQDLPRKLNRVYYNSFPQKPYLIEGAMELLKYLDRSYYLHIISNGYYDIQLTKMINSGISQYFTGIYTSDIIGYAKPNPHIFYHAFSSQNARKTEILVIGDDLKNDIMGAYGAGVDQFYFNRKDDKTDFSPTFEFKSLLELKSVL